MSTNVQIPTSLEEDILNYLKQQEREALKVEGDVLTIPDIPFTYAKTSEDDGDSCVKTILNDVLSAIERRGRLKNEYIKKLKEHNQYDLFDLSKIIPEFKIDDALAERLCFRETLIIGHLKPGQQAPHPSGGLCLNIETAKGSHPLDRNIPEFLGTPRDDPPEPSPADLREACEAGRIPSDEPEQLSSASALDLEGYKKMLQSEMRRERCKFLVHLSSQVDHGGRNGGSRVTAWVDRNFHTLEESRREYLTDQEETVDEKTLYVALQPHKRYYVRATGRHEEVSERKFYKLEKAKNYVSEGANFLLMRYLAVIKYKGQFELSTMYINGDMCRNIYICSGPETGIINDTTLAVCKIQRVIIEECGNIHRCASVLTAGGRLVKQDWESCDYVLYVNPLLELTDEKPRPYEKVALAKRWEDDMQLFSQYLDQKSAHSLQTRSYLKGHPELKNLIADYVTKILHMKPRTVIDFSTRYFTQCMPGIAEIARSEYWDDTEPPLYS